jgi:hypothetical protein
MQCLDVDLNEELARYRQCVEAHHVEAYHDEAAIPQDSKPQITGSIDTDIVHEHTMLSLTQASSVSTSSLVKVDAPITSVSPKEENGAIALHNDTPDGYLESSEALLRSLDELDDAKYPGSDESHSKSLSTRWSVLTTPFGIGSLMLLMLSTVTLGYVVANPSILGFGDTDPAAQDDAVALGDDTQSSRSSISADLTDSEFDELDLNTLPSIDRGFPTPLDRTIPSANDPLLTEDTQVDGAPVVPSNQPVASQPSSAPVLPRTVTQSSAQTPASLSAPATTPAPQPAPTQTQGPAPLPPVQPPSTAPAAPTPQPTAPVVTEQPQEGFVYVVAPFTGDRSLEQAQRAVPGAHLRNFPQGAQVQLGAFSETERAQTLVDQLNSQGIPAQLYRR